MSEWGRMWFEVSDEEAEQAKEKYGSQLPAHLIAYVLQMDEFNQEIFWKRFAANIEETIDTEFIRILSGLHKPVKDVPENLVSATPFKDAELSLSSGSWFGNGITRRLG